MKIKKKISIIIPVYNEQENIANIYEQVNESLDGIKELYCIEFVFINDGSSDNSLHILKQLAQADEHVKVINFSRNFGHQMALTAGYDVADGDAIISMDADLQDSPEILLAMIKKWQEGSDIVYARRINRKDSFLKRITASWYYKILDSVSEVHIPRNVGDFRLLDKKVVNILRLLPERARYLRGLVAWTGFKQDFVDFMRPNRSAGHTGYTWKKMLKLACDGLTSFSIFPLRIACFSGILMITFSAILFIFYGYKTLILHTQYALSVWVALIICFFLGLQSLFIWLLGEYVARIYDQQKGRPLYIVAEKINCQKSIESGLIMEQEKYYHSIAKNFQSKGTIQQE